MFRQKELLRLHLICPAFRYRSTPDSIKEPKFITNFSCHVGQGNKLDAMTQTKYRERKLRVTHNREGKRAWTLSASSRKDFTAFKYNHDKCLRNVLAVLTRKYGQDALTLDPPADARWNEFFIELDNGSMSPEQLRKKIQAYYSQEGSYRVLFIMKHEKPHLEGDRVKMINQISGEVLKGKKGRILAVGYKEALGGRLHTVLPTPC